MGLLEMERRGVLVEGLDSFVNWTNKAKDCPTQH